MKKLLLVFLLTSLFPFLSFSQITSNGTGGGAWNDTSTWSGGVVPTSTDDVVIQAGDAVTVSTTEACVGLTVNSTDATNYGTLTIETGSTLSTTGSTTIYGKLYITDGTFNEGNSSGDKLTINGANSLLSISGGTLNTSRYFALSNSASFDMTGGTMNVNSIGGSSSTNIFYIPSGSTFTMSSGTINILNGNSGTGAALKFNPTTSNVTGGTINFTNVKGYATTALISSNTLFDINSDVGTGDTLVIQNMSSSSDGFMCHNFSITSGTVQVDPGFGITVSNALTNNLSAANLVVASDTTGNGSLIVNGTVTGNTTVQRYIAAYSATANGWHEIGSPVNDMTISGSDFAPGSTSPNVDDLYAWDEATNTWLNYKVSGNNIANFTNGEGFLVAYETAATKNFTGTVNNTDISFSNLSYNTTQGDGWHLLGNPYSSALKWGDNNWSLTNVGGVAKVWNESSGNYSDVSSGEIIPSTNGFFVQVTSATNSLTIPAANRVHDASNNFKSTSVTNPKEILQFKVTDDANGYYDVSTLGFKANATTGFDNAYDSHKLFSMVKTAPSLWTISKKQDFSTNYIPETTTAYDVPLQFRAGVSTVYHLTIKGAHSFDNTGLVLEDLKTGEKIDLSNTDSYDFSAAKGDDVNRFVLHINGVTAVPDVNETDGIQVFSSGKTVYLHGQNMLNGKISIFNTLGQKVYEGLLNGAAKQQIRVNQHKGIYFVKVEENNHVFTKKVFIQ